ncbi:MAG TPA: hypothetical protein VNU97_06855 [Rhizomicrobium sp.]|jgi:hypothetical protein|nr:hypothetical protein [Rhizomicrobium sp.]
MSKLECQSGDGWVAYSAPPLYRIESRQNGERVAATVPGGDPIILGKLCACLEAPLFILYVLHTPRGEGEPGRYQSEEIDHDALNAFLARFGDYLSEDGRFDLWVYAPSQNATVAWDRHNVIFAYGATPCYEQALRALGFDRGELPVLGDHMHHYKGEYDADAAALLTAFDWHRTPLRPEDEQ